MRDKLAGSDGSGGGDGGGRRGCSGRSGFMIRARAVNDPMTGVCRPRSSSTPEFNDPGVQRPWGRRAVLPFFIVMPSRISAWIQVVARCSGASTALAARKRAYFREMLRNGSGRAAVREADSAGSGREKCLRAGNSRRAALRFRAETGSGRQAERSRPGTVLPGLPAPGILVGPRRREPPVDEPARTSSRRLPDHRSF